MSDVDEEKVWVHVKCEDSEAATKCMVKLVGKFRQLNGGLRVFESDLVWGGENDKSRYVAFSLVEGTPDFICRCGAESADEGGYESFDIDEATVMEWVCKHLGL